MDDEIEFEVRDRRGRLVRLRSSVYERHLASRPEMADLLEEVKQTIADPDIEMDDSPPGTVCRVYYRMGLGKGKWAKCYIKVPVYYTRGLWGEQGEVATFHFTRRIGRGRETWSRSKA